LIVYYIRPNKKKNGIQKKKTTFCNEHLDVFSHGEERLQGFWLLTQTKITILAVDRLEDIADTLLFLRP